MYDTILVATDGSPPSEAAAAEAIELASLVDATVHAVSVVDTLALAPMDSEAAAVERALEDDAEDALARVRERAEDAGVPLETEVRHGSPHDEILAHADAVGADAIYVGTHGRRGLDHLLLGSVAERVVRSADVPVTTVRAREEPGDATGESEQ